MPAMFAIEHAGPCRHRARIAGLGGEREFARPGRCRITDRIGEMAHRDAEPRGEHFPALLEFVPDETRRAGGQPRMGQRVGTDRAERIGGNGGDLAPVHALAVDDRVAIDAGRRGELTDDIEQDIFGLVPQPPVDLGHRRTFLRVVGWRG